MIATIERHGDRYTAHVESLLEYGTGGTKEEALSELADNIRELNGLLRDENLGPGMLKIKNILEQESVYTFTA